MATSIDDAPASITPAALGLSDLGGDVSSLTASVSSDLQTLFAPVGGADAGAEALSHVLPAVNPPPSPAGARYSAMYVFGDSLSDTGNDFAATAGGAPAAPYFDGRFSNGPVWVEDLAGSLGLAAPTPSLTGGTDFAYGGAETGATGVHAENPIDLPGQLTQFEAQVSTPDPNALYTLWIGSNDMLSALSESGSDPLKAQQAVGQALTNVSQFVSSLADLGMKHLLVMDVPDLGAVPATDGGGPNVEASAFARQFDIALGEIMHRLAQTRQLDLTFIDTYGLLDYAEQNPSAYGFTNTKDPVWSGGFTPGSGGTLAVSGAAQNQYLFFDTLHPTAHAHAILADAASRLLPA